MQKNMTTSDFESRPIRVEKGRKLLLRRVSALFSFDLGEHLSCERFQGAFGDRLVSGDHPFHHGPLDISLGFRQEIASIDVTPYRAP